MEPKEKQLKNLKPIQSTEEAREKGKKGGIKSGKVRKEKRLMSQIYADFLAKKHDVTLFDLNQKEFVQMKNVSTDEYFGKVVNNILSRADSSSVAQLREIAERTEGAKVSLVDENGKPLSKMVIEVEVVSKDSKKKNGNKKSKSKNT